MILCLNRRKKTPQFLLTRGTAKDEIILTDTMFHFNNLNYIIDVSTIVLTITLHEDQKQCNCLNNKSSV